MIAPLSTPMGNYSLTVTAAGEGAVKNASYVISVIRASVITVSGTVAVASYYPTVHLDAIQLQDIRTKNTYTAAPSNTFSGSYSIALQNGHSYNVSVNFRHGIGNILFPDSINAGILHVYAQVGTSTISGIDYILTLPA